MVAHALAPIDIEVQIHSMEIEAYGAVLRALIAQSDALSWGKEELITDLRRELRVSDAEHREILTVVKSDDLIKKIRELRQVGTQPGQVANVTNSFGYPSYSLSNMALKRPRTTTTVPVPTQFNAIGSRYEQGCRYVTIKIPRKGAEKPGFGTTNSDFDTIEILETNMLLDEYNFKGSVYAARLNTSGNVLLEGVLSLGSHPRHSLNTSITLEDKTGLIESVCGVEHPDPAMIAQAKSILKEHEKSLIEALNRLGDVPEDGY